MHRYDLTGQTLWPATDILSAFLLSPLPSTILPPHLLPLPSATFIELGAGTGLLSLLLLHLLPPRALTITDHNPTVLALIRANLALLPPPPTSFPYPTPLTLTLDWRSPPPSPPLPTPSPHEILIGSDLVYSIDDVTALIKFVARRLRAAHGGGGGVGVGVGGGGKGQRGIFVLGWLTRWGGVDAALYEAMRGEGLEWEEVALNRFMRVEAVSQAVRDHGHLLLITAPDR